MTKKMGKLLQFPTAVKEKPKSPDKILIADVQVDQPSMIKTFKGQVTKVFLTVSNVHSSDLETRDLIIDIIDEALGIFGFLSFMIFPPAWKNKSGGVWVGGFTIKQEKTDSGKGTPLHKEVIRLLEKHDALFWSLVDE